MVKRDGGPTNSLPSDISLISIHLMELWGAVTRKSLWENTFLGTEVLGNVGGKGAYVNIFKLVKKKGHRGSMKRKVLPPAECVWESESHLPAAMGDFLSSRSWMAVLANTTLLFSDTEANTETRRLEFTREPCARIVHAYSPLRLFCDHSRAPQSRGKVQRVNMSLSDH